MKKLKLLATISTLCLALMVLCFGVYSATNVSYTIGGSISYDVTDVMVKIETKVYKNTVDTKELTESELKTKAKVIESDTLEDFSNIEKTYGTATQSFVYDSLTGGDDGKAEGIKINYNTAKSWFIVVKVSSYTADKDTYFHLTKEELGDEANSSVYKSSTLAGIKKGASKNYVIALSVKDVKTSITGEASFTYNFDLGLGEAPKDALEGAKLEKLSDTTAKLVAYYGKGGEIDLTKTYSEEKITKITLLKATFGTFSEVQSAISSVDEDAPANASIEQLSAYLSQESSFVWLTYNNDGIATTDFIKQFDETTFNIIKNNDSYPITFDHSTFTLSKNDFSKLGEKFISKLGNLTKFSFTYDITIGSDTYKIDSTDKFNTLKSQLTSNLPKDDVVVTNVGKCDGVTVNVEGGNLKITQIGEYAFKTLDKPAIVTIPNIVTAIDMYGLYNCKEVTFEDNSQLAGLTSYMFANIYSLDGEKFNYNSLLEKIDLGSQNWTEIPKLEFYGCGGLKEIILSDSIETIKESSFVLCSSLKTIKFPANLKKIEEGSFGYCEKLESLILPDKLETLESRAFAYCNMLKSVTLPASLTSIQSNSFDFCAQILQVRSLSNSISSETLAKNFEPYAEILTDSTSIFKSKFTIGEKLVTYTSKDNVKYITGLANMKVKRIVADDIPDDIVNLGKYCFQDSYSALESDDEGLEYVEIPNHIKYNGNPFLVLSDDYSYSKLKEVAFEEGYNLTIMPMFYLMSGLEKITIPSSVTTLEQRVFLGCRSLKTLTIPNNIKTIESNAFTDGGNDCLELTSVIFEDPNNWIAKYNSEEVNLTLTNSSGNATYLRSTYAFYTWTKQS